MQRITRFVGRRFFRSNTIQNLAYRASFFKRSPLLTSPMNPNPRPLSLPNFSIYQVRTGQSCYNFKPFIYRSDEGSRYQFQVFTSEKSQLLPPNRSPDVTDTLESVLGITKPLPGSTQGAWSPNSNVFLSF